MSQNSATNAPQVVSPTNKRKNGPRRNESHIWNFMNKTDTKIICKVGDCTIEYSKSTGNSTLATHLANCHGIHEDTSADLSNDEQQSTTSPKNQRKGYSDQDRVTDFFVDFVISNIQSFALADDVKFRRFLNALNPKYVLPDRKTVREKIKEKFEAKKKEVKAKLSSINSKINITTDIWTSATKEPYISVTGHFIDEKWNLNSVLLDVFYFPHPHDGVYCFDVVKEVLINNFFLNFHINIIKN